MRRSADLPILSAFALGFLMGNRGLLTSFDAQFFNSGPSIQLAAISAITTRVTRSTTSSELPASNRPYTCQGSDGTNLTLPTIPNFIVAGAQKSGTTALHHILGSHPRIRNSARPEPHFFDLRGHLPMNASDLTNEQLCDFRRKYLKLFHWGQFENEDVLHFDKSPGYLPHSHIPALVSKICFWKPKIIVMIRNPIDRAFSQYKMLFRSRGDKRNFPSFEHRLAEELNKKWRQANVTRAPKFDLTINASTWLSMPEEAFALPPHLPSNLLHRQKRTLARKMLHRGLYAQQLIHWMEHFQLDTDLLVVQYERFQANQSRVLGEILGFLGLPNFKWDESILITNHGPKTGGKNVTSTDDMVMDSSTRAYLKRLYRPYNDELADLLGDKWRGIWD